MMFATMHDALPAFGFGALILVGAVLLDFAGVWFLRATGAHRFQKTTRVGAGSTLILLSVPVWAFGLFCVLIAMAIGDCPPDAYECPF
jgi:ABC-type dipeptide/oligopeptide/nickel transport system permease component